MVVIKDIDWAALTAKMAAIKDVDHQPERDEAEVTMKSIDHISDNKKMIEEYEKSLLEAGEDIPILQNEEPTLKSQLAELQESHDRDEKEFGIKKADWQKKNVRMETIAFSAETCSTSESDDNIDLDERIRLIEENARLLILRRNLKNLRIKIEQKQKQVNRNAELILAAKSVRSKLGPKILDLIDTIYKLESYLPSYKLHGTHGVNRTSEDHAVYLEEINVLKKTIAELRSEVASQKSINQNIPTALRAIKTPIEKLPEDKSKSVVENMEISFERGRKFHFGEMAGLYDAGCAVRARKLEWLSSTNDEMIIGLGNKASHYGMALADASLYQASCPAPYRRTDISFFTQLYGYSPTFVWKHQAAQQLLEVLDLHVAIKMKHRFDTLARDLRNMKAVLNQIEGGVAGANNSKLGSEYKL
ncbi:uncharacterized protein RAG0_13718 [Rhynchosporium agropyri]|uniref:Uncharacterized protein n=1 Tax=Rhynchosporium agropyri TaxID=914238 RepID=A0A1E1LG17_9HELO|nr:uncharacterized protein RAG0_13718 [Rhynchosporium agropyri]